ncbi:hypothetical protein [Nonomuraea turcica]|uniref:hypothetical protein n=1 Tax=Nonomuraea sp. G32 TaxID=3067274 RepID=UPI00273B1696|nr:hypothetical protein [Nonomuraea sp. G32]MDP4511288.1 hypothetical protein [Nonomuraea sp. G32]
MDLDEFDDAPGLFDFDADELATLPPVRFADLHELAADARQSPSLTRAAEYARGAEQLGYEPDDLPPDNREENHVFWVAANVGFLEVEEGFFAKELAFAWPEVSDAQAVEMWAKGMYGVIVANITDQLEIDLLDELLDQDPDAEDALPPFNDAFHMLVPVLLVALLRAPGSVPVSELRRVAVGRTGQWSWDMVAARQGDPLAAILQVLTEYGTAVVENYAVRLTPLGLYGTVFHMQQDGHAVPVAG